MPNDSVVVFIDYQNVYHRARGSFFHGTDPVPPIGHVHPRRVGELLCELGCAEAPGRALAGVRVYRGIPGQRIETATWRGPGENRGPLRIEQRKLWNHYLNQSHFDLVRDDTDYSKPSF